LAVGWLLTPGPGAVTGMIRTLGPWARKHWTVYQKFFYRASWSLDALSHEVLTRLVAPHLGATVDLTLDDTTCGRRGRHVAWAGWFKDASACARTMVIHWAHQWLLGAVTVRVPRQPLVRLALPVTFALYRKQADCDEAHPYATLPQLAARMVRQVAEALPGRTIAVATDGLYAVRAFFGDLPRGVWAVARLRKDAALRCWPVPPRTGRRGGPGPNGAGAPGLRGDRLPPLADLARRAKTWRPAVLLKQGRRVRRLLVGLTCQWYHVCRDRPVRVVLVHDPAGVEDDLFVVCTDPRVSDERIVQRYFDRWGIEECIEEAKQHLGMERLRGWCRRTVPRQAPLALLLGTLVKLWYVEHAAKVAALRPETMPWYRRKRTRSFRDMPFDGLRAVSMVERLAALRKAFWHTQVLCNFHPDADSYHWLHALTYALCEAA
jgi:hypothetical protein